MALGLQTVLRLFRPPPLFLGGFSGGVGGASVVTPCYLDHIINLMTMTMKMSLYFQKSLDLYI